ncbi:MAG: hypothetical protein ACI9XZ_004285 [Alphaproteobacteria bacterium]|jgi:hypothetical protein
MKPTAVKNYGSNLKKIAEANARDDQMQAIRTTQFKASLVDDPLRASPDLVRAIENSRNNSRK